MFRQSWPIVLRNEGANDGLVSVSSSMWGEYKGTLNGVSHLDLINWTNRLRWFFFELSGGKRKYATYSSQITEIGADQDSFNAVALYLDIAGECRFLPHRFMCPTQLTSCIDMLAKEGL